MNARKTNKSRKTKNKENTTKVWGGGGKTKAQQTFAD